MCPTRCEETGRVELGCGGNLVSMLGAWGLIWKTFKIRKHLKRRKTLQPRMVGHTSIGEVEQDGCHEF